MTLNTSLPWQPIETARSTGPKFLVAHRHTKSVAFIWPAEAQQPASDGSKLFSHWCEVTHPLVSLNAERQ